MGADTTFFKKRRKKSNGHDNHSRKTRVWKRREVVNFVGTYGHFAHPMSMITTAGKHLANSDNGDRW